MERGRERDGDSEGWIERGLDGEREGGDGGDRVNIMIRGY